MASQPQLPPLKLAEWVGVVAEKVAAVKGAKVAEATEPLHPLLEVAKAAAQGVAAARPPGRGRIDGSAGS